MRRYTLIFALFFIPLLCKGQQNNLVASKDTAWFEPGDLFNAYQEVVIKVHPSLPNYRITFRVDQLAESKGESIRTTEYVLKTFKGEQRHPHQVITDTTTQASIWIGNTYDDDQEFPDINFDGYKDLPITLSSSGSGTSRYFDFWLFDKRSGKFVPSNTFSNLFNPRVNSTKQEIICSAIYGCQTYSCGTTEIYKVIADSLKLVRREVTELETIESQKYYIRTTEELINGVLEVAKRDTSKIEY